MQKEAKEEQRYCITENFKNKAQYNAYNSRRKLAHTDCKEIKDRKQNSNCKKQIIGRLSKEEKAYVTYRKEISKDMKENKEMTQECYDDCKEILEYEP